MASVGAVVLLAACGAPSSSATSPTPSASSIAGSPTPSPSNPAEQVSVVKLTIHTGVDPGWPTQNPLYLHAVARGHYIVATLSGGSANGKAYVAYDGRLLAALETGYDIAVVTLSPNGIHYGYTVLKLGSTAATIYVDGRLYRSAPGWLDLYAITNAGEPVYATAFSPPSREDLYLGVKVIATAPRGFIVARVSGDGSHWLAYERRDISGAGQPGPLILDGQALLPSTDSFPQDQFIQLSENGRHWSCYLQDVGTGNLLIDGVSRSTASALGNLELTDSGHVAWVDNVDGSAHVDDRVIKFPSPGASRVYINDDASHALVIMQSGAAILDGSPLDLRTSVAEIDAATVYAYIFVQ